MKQAGMAEAFQIANAIEADGPFELYVMKAYDFSEGKAVYLFVLYPRLWIQVLIIK